MSHAKQIVGLPGWLLLSFAAATTGAVASVPNFAVWYLNSQILG